MRAPEFWTTTAPSAPMLRALAWPLSRAVEAIGAVKVKTSAPMRVNARVICVGNVTLGGVGKTPVARTIAATLRAEGAQVALLLRGYGGARAGPHLVQPGIDAAREVGDEALLHARDGTTWIARDRRAGARAAIEAGADCIVMDDGFQNMGLAKDLALLVFDAEAGLGNGRVFPAGPLRESLSGALARADGAIVIGDGEVDGLARFKGPILRAKITPAQRAPPGKLVVFAGIGRPEKFFASVSRAGGDIAEALPFPDHHVYTDADLRFLERLARERGATLLTTEKDHVRLKPARRAQIAAFAVTAAFLDPGSLTALLAHVRDAR